MTDIVEIERKVHQLDNDVLAIYDMLHSISETQTDHTTQLTTVNHRLTGVEGRLTTLDHRLAGVEGQLTAVEDQLTGIAAVQEQHGTRLHAMDGKLDLLVQTVGAIARPAGGTDG